ncbi:MAG: helix-turn-helix protein [uncultured bacterium (gcode 4)]|uniref:Helix-turn-helix protein n=1 Tax=uncultured bacterium (gcode 4) TaxID=1234023 RepID=K2FU55_9BACT|nr:MAG: helix-turn-helix protein [uncultured bacterium (gcode 4)]
MGIKTKFWDRVRKLRKKQWLSQEWLAEICKLHRTYIWIIERGEKNVCLENIELLAKALKVEVKDLFI